MNRFQIKQIKKLGDRKKHMTPFEKEFIDSLIEKIDQDDSYELSEKQNAVLNRMISSYV